jgi:hypothetical protein
MMSDTSKADNVVPFKKRRRALTNRAALQFLREAGGEGGAVEVASGAELGRLLGWERTRASKALRSWQRAGKATFETDPETGKITIRVMPDRREMEREKTPGNSRSKRRETGREKHHREKRESVRNTDSASDTYPISELAEQESRRMPAQTQSSPLSERPFDREISRPEDRMTWRRRSGNGGGIFPVPGRGQTALIDILAYAVAIALAVSAAYFSVSCCSLAPASPSCSWQASWRLPSWSSPDGSRSAGMRPAGYGGCR